jgi:hypothetical protein
MQVGGAYMLGTSINSVDSRPTMRRITQLHIIEVTYDAIVGGSCWNLPEIADFDDPI